MYMHIPSHYNLSALCYKVLHITSPYMHAWEKKKQPSYLLIVLTINLQAGSMLQLNLIFLITQFSSKWKQEKKHQHRSQQPLFATICMFVKIFNGMYNTMGGQYRLRSAQFSQQCPSNFNPCPILSWC